MTDNIIDLKPAPSPEPEPEFVLSLERQREIYETALEAGRKIALALSRGEALNTPDLRTEVADLRERLVRLERLLARGSRKPARIRRSAHEQHDYGLQSADAA